MAKIEAIRPPICRRCGLPFGSDPAANPGTLVCDDCERAPLQLDGLLAYAYHSGPLREAIHQFKYEDLRSLAGPLGKLMGNGWAILAPPNLEIDTIVPVPLHPTRQRQRGYNQSVLLARELGVALARPVVEDVLMRTKATAPQVELNALERRANVQDAFQCASSALSGKRVLLVDDVCTTGCTLEAACLALRASGANSVWAYALARARPGLHDVEHKSTERRRENGADYQGEKL